MKNKVLNLHKVFYHGEKMSDLEREIERAYIKLKENTYHAMMSEKMLNENKSKIDIVLTYSDINKINNLKNFRANHPDYYYPYYPEFERINIDIMFNSLYYIRYNNIETSANIFKNYYNKLMLKYEYRNSINKLGSITRIKFVSQYIFNQILIFLDCYVFHEEFNFLLNFKLKFNLIAFHIWVLISQFKLNDFKDKTNYGSIIIKELEDLLEEYSKRKLLKYDEFKKEGIFIKNINDYIKQFFNYCDAAFKIIPKFLSSNNNLNDNKENDFINNDSLYACSLIFVNEILELNLNNQLEMFFDNASYLAEDLENIENNFDKDMINNLKNKITHKITTLNHLTEYCISFIHQISSKSYFDLEKVDYDLTLFRICQPIIYNHRFLKTFYNAYINCNNNKERENLSIKDFVKLIQKTKILNGVEMVRFVINENNILSINNNIKDGKYKDITSSTLLEIDKMLVNPHLSEKFVENKNDNKPSLLMRFVEKYNREMFIENDLLQEEIRYNENNLKNEFKGKELQMNKLMIPFDNKDNLKLLESDNGEQGLDSKKTKKKMSKDKLNLNSNLGLNALIPLKSLNSLNSLNLKSKI